MQFTPTALPEVILIEPRVFGDDRGFFMETYSRRVFAENGIDLEFVQYNHSHSSRDTLRGLHYQVEHPQAKLVRAVLGTVYDVVVDIRHGSPTFGRWIGVELSATNRRMLFVPVGFAHGFCVISATADVIYACSDYYHPAGERGLIWNDPDLNISWPTPAPLLSPKDQRNLQLKDLPADFTFHPRPGRSAQQGK
ncbi:MAG: dTDP-4-dehydrorhamnose 3,5-epimerase [Kiritimatiellia bacterium]|nr:dTDP-4-dehydrorhamnose 3,5-epimerase [Lentisphaerota bacterium]